MHADALNKEVACKPTYCCIAVTEACFMKCKMCYKGKDGILRDPKEADINYWKRFISSLREFVDGRLCINFSGGEALIRQDVLELIKYSVDLDFHTLLCTNGYLIDKEMALKIAESGLNEINISLDSINEATHDHIRGIPGSYARVMQAIEYLNKYCNKAKIGICCVINGINLGSITQLAQWIEENKKISVMFFQAITQPFNTQIEDNWQEKNEYNPLWPKDIALVKGVLDELIRYKKMGYKMNNSISQFKAFKSYFESPGDFIKKVRCRLDEKAVNVTPLGEVHICFYMDPIGNIKQPGFDIKQIWLSDHAKEVRERIKNCKRNCQSVINCNFDELEEVPYGS